MKPNTQITAMHDEASLTPNEIIKLREKTAAYLKRIKWKNGNNTVFEIPFDLLVRPTTQTNRANMAEIDGSIDALCANYNDNWATPGIVNVRTDGPCAGLMFIIDGNHRARTRERLAADKGFKGALSIIRQMNNNEERALFAKIEYLQTPKSAMDKYNAWIESNDLTDIDVKTAHTVHDILCKYHVDTAIKGGKGSKYPKIALGAALDICRESLSRGNDCFDWIISTLVVSGCGQTDYGLSRGTLLSLCGFYYMIISGRFGKGVTPESAQPILIEKLTHHTWGTVQDLGIAIQNEQGIHVATTSQQTRAKRVFAYWICKAFNLDAYGYVDVA